MLGWSCDLLMFENYVRGVWVSMPKHIALYHQVQRKVLNVVL